MDQDAGETSSLEPMGREANRGEETERTDAMGEGPGARPNLNLGFGDAERVVVELRSRSDSLQKTTRHHSRPEAIRINEPPSG